MKKIIPLLISILFSVNVYTQSCTSTVYYDNMETFTWVGNWWLYNFSDFRNNYSVSPSFSAVHRGTGSGTSNLEEDWYVLPQITGLNSNYTYKVRFKLASYTVTAPTALTRGLDGADILQVQLSRNGGVYLPEITISGFDGQLWNYNATGVVSKTADGINSNYGRTGTTRYGICGNCYSTIELILPPNTDSFAIDIYTKCNAAGEEFWIDNVELIEIIPTPNPGIFGDSVVCLGDPVILTAVGGDVFSWSNGITNGVSFVPSITTTYSVTTTYNGMINGDNSFNTCTSVLNKLVNVIPDCALPIYLSTFDGHNEGRENHLYWLTEQEINSSHFEVERSNNGYEFVKIGIVGTDPTQSYNFIDNTPYSGSNYYRLKMVDLDETFSHSSIIYLETQNKIESKVYPNPFEDSLIYMYQSEQNEELEIQVINILGQRVLQYNVNCQTCGNYVTINTSNVPSGKYTIRIKHLTSLHETFQTMIKK